MYITETFFVCLMYKYMEMPTLRKENNLGIKRMWYHGTIIRAGITCKKILL